MNGNEILVDTNIVLYLLEGNEALADFLQGKRVYISFISELELLGFKDITVEEERDIIALLSDCIILPLTDQIKSTYIQLRRSRKIKLADALVAATSIVTDVPLITADTDFKNVVGLNLVTYKHGNDLP